MIILQLKYTSELCVMRKVFNYLRVTNNQIKIKSTQRQVSINTCIFV